MRKIFSRYLNSTRKIISLYAKPLEDYNCMCEWDEIEGCQAKWDGIEDIR